MTPQMQASMRTTQTKALKRGRKAKGKKVKGKKGKGGNGVLQRKASKLNILKSTQKGTGKGKQNKGKSQELDAPSKADHKKVPKAKSASVTKGKGVPKSKSASPKGNPVSTQYQGRVWMGSRWVYQVLADQTLGCANCRFIYNGCAHCRKPSFRGKSAETMRNEQESVETDETWEGSQWDESMGDGIAHEPCETRPKKKTRKPSLKKASTKPKK